MKYQAISAKLMLAALFVVGVAGCASTETEMTSLEIQAFQTHEFEAPKKTVFASVVSVFQDLGYIVESADVETGFITSASASINKTGFWQAMGGVASSGRTRATAFVEEIRPNFVTVRLNFVDTQNQSTAYGQQRSEDKPITDPEPYQVAFDKLEEAVFIRLGAT